MSKSLRYSFISPTTPAYSPTTPAYSPTPPYRESDECKETQPAPTVTSSASEEHKSSWTDEDTRQAVDFYFTRRESGVSSSDTFAGATSIETWVEAANTLLSVAADQTSCSDVTLSTSSSACSHAEVFYLRVSDLCACYPSRCWGHCCMIDSSPTQLDGDDATIHHANATRVSRSLLDDPLVIRRDTPFEPTAGRKVHIIRAFNGETFRAVTMSYKHSKCPNLVWFLSLIHI